MSEKKEVIICTCSPGCPGFAKIDFVALGNRIQTEIPDAKYATLFVQLCEDPGIQFLKEHLKPGNKYVISACKEHRLKKLIEEAIDETGINWEKDVVVVNPTGDTEDAFNLIKDAFNLIKEAF